MGNIESRVYNGQFGAFSNSSHDCQLKLFLSQTKISGTPCVLQKPKQVERIQD